MAKKAVETDPGISQQWARHVKNLQYIAHKYVYPSLVESQSKQAWSRVAVRVTGFLERCVPSETELGLPPELRHFHYTWLRYQLIPGSVSPAFFFLLYYVAVLDEL